ncbi:MAG: hypothetical protein M3O91_10580 [Chloroflexota bacterium]|nr:hypothetical protein [Chloroflexota bacterium]
MLIREGPATELTVATRVLAHSRLLDASRRITSLVGEVVYVCARGIASETMTPYDVVAVRLADGLRLHGEPPSDLDEYLARHRGWPGARSVVRLPDGAFLGAPSVPACVVAAQAAMEEGGTLDVPPEGPALARIWEERVALARAGGALFGVEP